MMINRWIPVKTGLVLLAGLGLVNVRIPAGTAAEVTAPSTGLDFALTDQDGRTHRLADYRGKPVVLVFYPDLEAESLAQLRSLRDAQKGFDALGIKLFALSSRPAADLKPVYGAEKLRFPLLSDTNGTVAARYRTQMPGARSDGRMAFVLGPGGKILLPVRDVQTAGYGEDLVKRAEHCLNPESQARSQPRPQGIGKPVSDFLLPRVTDGKMETLYGNVRNKATVVFFISAHCPCSQGYDGRMAETARAYAAKGVRFLAVNSCDGEAPADIAEHARRSDFPFPVLRDGRNVIADRFGAKVTPEVFVVDENRILRYQGRVDDSRDEDLVKSRDLRNALDAVLAGRQLSLPVKAAFGCAIARAQ